MHRGEWVPTVAVDRREPSMMFPGWGRVAWVMASYGFVVLLILVGIVVALVAPSGRTGRIGPTATELLAQRFGRGEIDDAEYFTRLSMLESTREQDRLTDGAR
jgi:putative membrane protein